MRPQSGVGITILEDPSWRTVVHTDDEVLALDRDQYARGMALFGGRADTSAGPGRHGIRRAAVAGLCLVARATGVHATLSIPLIRASAVPDGDDELVGSLNAYSRSATAFDVFDEKLLGLYTGAASQILIDARRGQRLRKTVDQLERALVSRTDIDQAKGVLRTRHGGTADDAFAFLVEQSQRENIKLRDIARRVLNELA